MKEEIKTLLTRIQLFTNKHQDCFPKKDFDYISEFCSYASNLNEHNQLDNHLHSQWNRFNVRYGLNSIKGFFSEVAAIVIWNRKPSISSKLYLHPSSKQEQVSGIDLVISNPKWRSNYKVQVKSLYRINGQVQVYPNYFQYNSWSVDRMILVDTNGMILLCVDYPIFKEQFKRQAYIPIAELRQVPHSTWMSL